MLKKNDEKINGFLFVIVFPLLLFAMSYHGFESSCSRLKTSAKIPDLPSSYVYAYKMIPDCLSVSMNELLCPFDQWAFFFEVFHFVKYFYFAI